jgi:Xaa-Pro aminopeptidase
VPGAFWMSLPPVNSQVWRWGFPPPALEPVAVDTPTGRVQVDIAWPALRIGIELESYYYSPKAQARLVAGLPDAEFIEADLLVNWIRAKKSLAEIDYMRKAARLVEAAGLAPKLEIRSETFGQRHFIVADPSGVLIDVITEIPPGEEYAENFRE